MYYFTSDTHFDHDNIRKYCDRPFSSVEEMNNTLIKNWNNLVRKNDIIYILGDFSMTNKVRYAELLKMLNGRKILICGNHDYSATKVDQSLFEKVCIYDTLKYKGEYIVMFHYPIEEWDRKYHGSIHLHGHSHNKPEYNLKQKENGVLKYDVGVDANNFCPVSIEQIFEFFNKK